MTRAALFLIVAVAVVTYGSVIAVVVLHDWLVLTVAVLAVALAAALIVPLLRADDLDDVRYPAAPDAPEPDEQVKRAKGGVR